MKKFALLALMATAAAHAYSQDTIRFGVEAQFPPFESKTSAGKLVGFDIELGDAICAQMKAKCQWVENSFDGMIPALKAKKFDAILSSMSINEERMKQIDFSDKLYNTPIGLIVGKKSGIKPQLQVLKGKRVGVLQGSIFETYAKQKWAPNGVTVVSYQSTDLVYADLVAGRLDAALDDAVAADAGLLKKPDGKGFMLASPTVHDDKIFGPGTGIGLRKEDTALRQKINHAIAAILKNGTYKTIEKKYFAFDVYNAK
jgi:lysine-arginine-ornithine-binding protein